MYSYSIYTVHGMFSGAISGLVFHFLDSLHLVAVALLDGGLFAMALHSDSSLSFCLSSSSSKSTMSKSLWWRCLSSKRRSLRSRRALEEASDATLFAVPDFLRDPASLLCEVIGARSPKLAAALTT